MSAFEVSTTHIDAMLTAGLVLPGQFGPLRWMAPGEVNPDSYREGDPWGPGAHEEYERRVRYLTDDTAGQVGAMLMAENRRSVDHRYAETEIEMPYLFHALAGTPDPTAVLKAISCYRYQSCEHPGWETSEAYAFCDSLEGAAIRALAGWDAAPWEINDRNVFVRPAVEA